MRLFIAIVTALLFSQALQPYTFAEEAVSAKNKKVKKSDNRGLVVTEKNRDGRKRIALVIGNSSYASSPLKNPVNDARAMASTLRKLGFDVEEKTNLGYIAMNEAVEAFGNRMKSGGVGLFYYAGHGMQVQGNNYLVPVDAKINSENEVRYKAVDAGLVLAKMESAKSDVNIVVLDACRDNPFGRSFRSSSRGLANMEAPTGTIIAYATSPGKTAADGDGKNGVYTEALMKALEFPGLKVEDVFKQVRKMVVDKTDKVQVPWESSSLMGDFHFVPPSQMSDLKASEVRSQPVAPLQKKLPGKPVVTEPPKPVTVSGITDRTTGIEFVIVPGGCFTTNGRQVCLDEFSIGKFEVTQGQWKRVMGNNQSHFSSCGDDCPVDSVSWNDAQEFITKLNQQTGFGYRLPTEAEWEYSCRSGGKQEKYCGSNDGDRVAWHEKNSNKSTHHVGTKQPNGLGIYDMSGNVSEWVSDWLGSDNFGREYPSSSRNPTGPVSGKYRVLRGNSWKEPLFAYDNRGGNEPDRRYDSIGFRIATSSQQPPLTTPPLAAPVKSVIEKPTLASSSREFIDPTTGMEFVNVSGGCFQMGDIFGDGDADEKPVHEVCIGNFAIGRYEVTQGQWKRIMDNNPSFFRGCGDNCPVESVSWNDAQIFIDKLNRQSSGRFRLPTEAEWEYAARSGGKQERYSGGDNVDAVAWHGTNIWSTTTHPVGQKQPNGLGIYDMSGNVWELVNDRFGKYAENRQKQDPTGPTSGWDRVIRGGSHADYSISSRTSNRGTTSDGIRTTTTGFRLAAPVQ